MAKYRMIELGYPEAEGVYGYIDGQRSPDHGCSDRWEPGTVYSISRSEAAELLRRSPDFYRALKSGCYSNIEGHYCLDDDKYVETVYGGNRRLTAYARTHIDECCISFTIAGRYADPKYETGRAVRNKKKETLDRYQSRHAFGAEPRSKEGVMENKLFADDAAEWQKLKNSLPRTFKEAVQMIIDLKGDKSGRTRSKDGRKPFHGKKMVCGKSHSPAHRRSVHSDGLEGGYRRGTRSNRQRAVSKQHGADDPSRNAL